MKSFAGPEDLAAFDPRTRPLPFQANFPSPAASSRPCIAAGCGRCGSTPASGRPPNRTSAIATCSSQGVSGLSVAFDLPTQIGYDTRSRPGRRRGRARRRGDRFDRGHGGAVRRHPARQGVDVDDDQRDRDHPAGAVCRGRQAAGCGAEGSVGHDPERHPQGIHRARDLHLPAAGVAAHRHRHIRVLRAGGAAVEHDLDQRLPHPRSRIDGGAGGRVHVRQRDCLRRGGARRPGSTSTRSGSGSRSSSTRTTTSSRRSRSSARRGGCGRASCATASARPTRARSSCASTPRPPAAR